MQTAYHDRDTTQDAAFPRARAMPRDMGEKARGLGSNALDWGRDRARSGRRALRAVAPFCVSSVALIAVLGTLGSLRQNSSAFERDHEDRLRELQMQIRALEASQAWQPEYELDLRHLENDLELLEVGDQVYLYRSSSVGEEPPPVTQPFVNDIRVPQDLHLERLERDLEVLQRSQPGSSHASGSDDSFLGSDLGLISHPALLAPAPPASPEP